MTDEATRLRDAGRSWTEISDRLGVSVREAKRRVEEDKRVRRKKLSETKIAEDRNGLRDMCYNNKCDHLRKEHDESGCTICGPERTAYEYWNEPFDGTKITVDERQRFDDGRAGYPVDIGCNEFVHQKRTFLPWYRLPKEEDPQYVDPDVKLTGNNKIDALLLGIQDLRFPSVNRSDIPHPSIKNAVRRQRKKLRAGKPVKKHRDRIKRR